MPFKEQSIMEQRLEFVLLTLQPGSNISVLCNRYNISRRTGYKWIYRYKEKGAAGLKNISRRPHFSPLQTEKEIEQYIIKLRKQDPEWGAKKLLALIKKDQQDGKYLFSTIPSKTTINKILKRNELINPERSAQSKKYLSFEYEYPNELWQMDYKGYFSLLNLAICYPLTITDDHSRFNLCLSACKNQKEQTVKHNLIGVFRKYGLPSKILTDNASPWGSAGMNADFGIRAYTSLEKWLIQLNIKLIHGKPYHPQTQGKEERFHRTLKQELLNYEQFRDHTHCQERFDCWREKYNCKRPHESLDFLVPAQRYSPSNRAYPENIKSYEYDNNDQKRKVQKQGIISFKGKDFRVGKAFIGDYVAIKETEKENKYEVYYCNNIIRYLNL